MIIFICFTDKFYNKILVKCNSGWLKISYKSYHSIYYIQRMKLSLIFLILFSYLGLFKRDHSIKKTFEEVIDSSTQFAIKLMYLFHSVVKTYILK